MKKAFIIIALVIGFSVAAQEYPVRELGGCQNKEECFNYCDQLENTGVCTAYAITHGLFSPEQLALAQSMIPINQGPGGCQTFSECRAYCNDFNHIEECYDFSKEHKLVLECDLVDARKVIEAMKEGVVPLPCQGKEACQEYCFQEENLEQCLDFAQAVGFLSSEQALLIKETGGRGPGSCQGEECQEYCFQEENLEECLSFAKEHGFMSEEQAAQVIAYRDIANQGGPGDCQGLKECADYCSKKANLNECIEFAQEQGFIGEEEIKEIKELAEEGGPGKCKTREECKEYCLDPENGQECLHFMLDKAYIPEQILQEIEKEIEEAKEVIDQELEKFREYYETEEEFEEYKKQIEEELEKKLEPYRNTIQGSRKRQLSQIDASRSIADRIVRQRKANSLVRILNSFLASAAQRFLR